MSKISPNIEQLKKQFTHLTDAYTNCILARRDIDPTERSFHIKEAKRCLEAAQDPELVSCMEETTKNYAFANTPQIMIKYIEIAMPLLIEDAVKVGEKMALDDQAKSKQAEESNLQNTQLATLTSENEKLKKQLTEVHHENNAQKQVVQNWENSFPALSNNLNMIADSINSVKKRECHPDNEQEQKIDSQAQEETETQQFKAELASFTNNATNSTSNAANSVTANEQAYSTANEEKDQSAKPFWDINGEVNNNPQQDNTEVSVTGNVNEQLSEHHS